VNFPLIFGMVLALFGAATLVHLLVVSVSRRGREIALLKALGFVNGQVVGAVSWQATTVALVGIVIGVPLGFVVPVAVVQAWLLVSLIGSVLLAANLFAIAPALAATRSKPNQVLRAP
jgi:ABC-type antimicrobial peptide transport system permease subunit